LPEDISLENLVPEEHFYRRLEARLDLSFVRELVEPLYAGGGRPSVDPVVFFKLCSSSCSSRTSGVRGSS
jgi:transposase